MKRPLDLKQIAWPVLVAILISACGVIPGTGSNEEESEEARMAKQNLSESSKMSNSMLTNQDINNKWNAMYGNSSRSAKDSSSSNNTSLSFNISAALTAAQNAAKTAPKNTSGYSRGAAGTSGLSMRIEGTLNTYFPNHATVDTWGGIVGYYGGGIIYAQFINDVANGGYYLKTAVPFVYPYPTGIPALAYLGYVYASGNGQSPDGAVAAGYVDGYGAVWAFAKPGLVRVCYVGYGYPVPYCYQTPS